MSPLSGALCPLPDPGAVGLQGHSPYRTDRFEAGARACFSTTTGAAGLPDGAGRGVRVVHLDTGYVPIDEFEARLAGTVDLRPGRNLLADCSCLPLDSLQRQGFVPSPGHGTSTLSVILGDGTYIPGMAPEAIVEPWRVTPSIALQKASWRSNVARAIRTVLQEHAQRPGEPLIITMSLGWIRTGAELRAALAEAERQGVLVFASAGQVDPGVSAFIPYVSRPANLPSVFGIAGCSFDRKAFSWSGRGNGVDLTVAAEWVPRVDVAMHAASVASGTSALSSSMPGRSNDPAPEHLTTLPGPRSFGRGTSYAAAIAAGAAATWVRYWLDRPGTAGGRAVRDAIAQRRLPELFRQTLASCGLQPPDLSEANRNGSVASRWGAGVLDMACLLDAAPRQLPPRGPLRKATTITTDLDDLVDNAADLLGTPVAMRPRLTEVIRRALAVAPTGLFRGPLARRVEARVQRSGDHVLTMISDDPELRAELEAAGLTTPEGAAEPLKAARKVALAKAPPGKAAPSKAAPSRTTIGTTHVGSAASDPSAGSKTAGPRSGEAGSVRAVSRLQSLVRGGT